MSESKSVDISVLVKVERWIGNSLAQTRSVASLDIPSEDISKILHEVSIGDISIGDCKSIEKVCLLSSISGPNSINFLGDLSDGFGTIWSTQHGRFIDTVVVHLKVLYSIDNS